MPATDTARPLASLAQPDPRSRRRPDAACWILEAKHPRLGQVVVASSPRRDVRELRAKIVLVIDRSVCPSGCRPKRRWYRPGTCERFGVRGLRRRWAPLLGELPPSERTLRRHLESLERHLVLVRAPGHVVPVVPGMEHRPRYPDAFALLYSDQEAEWWERVGCARLGRSPAARRSRQLWDRLFGSWRTEARQGAFDFVSPAAIRRGVTLSLGDMIMAEKLPPRPPGRPDALAWPGERGYVPSDVASRVVFGIRRGPDPAALIDLAREAGCRLRGPIVDRMRANPRRLAEALALFALAAARGDRIRNRAAWLVAAFEHGARVDLQNALRVVMTRDWRASLEDQRERAERWTLHARSMRAGKRARARERRRTVIDPPEDFPP